LTNHGNGHAHMRTGQNPNRARALRRSQADVECRLWRLLRDRRLEGFKFRRQQSIGPYFADFACISRRLVVEADGGQHSERAGYDQARTAFLESCGYRVIRFWNHEVMQAQEAVLEEILRVLRAG
jgi:very-short-patch-repair endonuclease